MQSVLHGRDEPLQTLRAALDSACAGRGHLALVSGEAGIGKSAIATAIAREAEARGAAVTWGRAWEFADAPPYFPVAPCLAALGITAEGQDAFKLWESVLAVLARGSRERAVVWMLEDLHAADLGTLDLLTFLALPLRAMHVLVVATARDRDPRLTDRSTQRLTRMARDGIDVRLDPLSERDVAMVTQATMGRAVPEGLLRRLVDLTGGNPLFVVECARAFRMAGGLEGTLSALPTTVRQVVLDRVALLPEATRRALASGAILGREFSAALVARMHDALPARVIDTLLPALRCGLVTETKPGQFLFSHALVRDAIDEAVGAEERAASHGRADLALAAMGESPQVLVERARHALLALGQTGNVAHALAVAGRASAVLERESAFDRALELHTRIEDARAAGFLPPASPAEELHLARIARAAGRTDVTRRVCERVMAAARTSRSGEMLARAVLLHGADVRPGVIDRSQVARLEEARLALGDDAPLLACRLLARHATSLQPALDQALPMSMLRDALRLARATGDEAAVLDVLEQARWGLYNAPLAERIAVASELRERATIANDRDRALEAHAALAFYQLEAGDFTALHEHIQNMLALSDEIGHPRHRWRALLLASMYACMVGEFAEAERCVTEVRQLAGLVDDPNLQPSLALHDVMRRRLQRRDDEVDATFPELETVLHDFLHAAQYVALVRAACAARARNVEVAREALAGLGDARWFLTDPTCVALVAEAYALVGTLDQRRLMRDLIAGWTMTDVPGDQLAFSYEGTAVRLLGLLDASLGKLDDAEKELRAAHDLALHRKHKPWIAQSAYELALVLRGAGPAVEARTLLESCVQLARELGMTGLHQSAGDALHGDRGEEETGPESIGVPSALRFEKQEGSWRIARGARAVTVKDSRGMQLLARLAERPGEEIHVLTLASDEATPAPQGSAGELLDERAREAYRRRVRELDEALAEAEQDADLGRLAKLRPEREALLAELRRAVGLAGRARTAASATERARVNVQRRLRDAISRVTEADEALGRYFERAVRTGTFCCFRP